MTDNYRAARDAAQRELDELLQKRSQIEKRILRLKETVTALNALCGDQPKRPAEMPRMTEAVRSILYAADDPLTPVEVRDKLLATGFSLKAYKNPLASIHVVLKRLADSQQFEAVTESGTTKYRARLGLLEGLRRAARDPLKF